LRHCFHAFKAGYSRLLQPRHFSKPLLGNALLLPSFNQLPRKVYFELYFALFGLREAGRFPEVIECRKRIAFNSHAHIIHRTL
jgi:hypothetical protein